MNSRPKDPKTARNKNVLVIGGSGSGKTRFWLKPNLMQMHSSYVVTDPKGTILVECGKMLQRGTPKLGKDGKPMKDKRGKVIYEPYRIKVLNTINFKKSMHYNWKCWMQMKSVWLSDQRVLQPRYVHQDQKRQVRQNAARRIPEQSLPLRVSQKRRWQNGTEPGNRCCGTAHFPTCRNRNWSGSRYQGTL